MWQTANCFTLHLSSTSPSAAGGSFVHPSIFLMNKTVPHSAVSGVYWAWSPWGGDSPLELIPQIPDILEINSADGNFSPLVTVRGIAY